MGGGRERPPRAGAAAGLVGMAVCTKTRLPQTTGEAAPAPGIFTFHLTFLVSLQARGGVAEGDTPVASGPRMAGQFSSPGAAAAGAADAPAINASKGTMTALSEEEMWFMRFGSFQ